MIGLRRGTVRLRPHHKKWLQVFEDEKKKIRRLFGSIVIDIQHVGSTAIPGIHAKPIIDMSLGLRRFKDAEKLVKPLAALGYGFYKHFDKQILFAKGPDRKRTHYLHVMKHNGSKWKSDLLFREYLVSHPRRAQQYHRLKQKLAQKYPHEREKYSQGKKEFIEETIRRARIKHT